MTASLRFEQTYEGGRILLMLGQHEIGATFPPSARPGLSEPWRWRFWLTRCAKEGHAKTELAAKNRLLSEAREWLQKAGLE